MLGEERYMRHTLQVESTVVCLLYKTNYKWIQGYTFWVLCILFVTSIIVILSDIPTHFCHSSLVLQVTMDDNSLDSGNNGKRAPSTYTHCTTYADEYMGYLIHTI